MRYLANYRHLAFASAALLLSGSSAARAQMVPLPGNAGGISWPQQGGLSNSANNTVESLIGSSNVSTLMQFGKYPFSGAQSGMSIGPVVLAQKYNKNLTTDTAYVNNGGNIYAFPALGGSVTWQSHLAGNTYNSATPAIDPGSQFVYNVGSDGAVHKYDAASGSETLVANVWPAPFTASPSNEFAVAALTIGMSGSTPFLYVATTANQDASGAAGSVTTINLSTGAQTTFNTMCPGSTGHVQAGSCGSGLSLGSTWSRAGMTFDSGSGRVFVGTGNNSTNSPSSPAIPPSSTNFFNDSLLALPPGGGSLLDFNSPNASSIPPHSPADYDMGTTNPLILTSLSNPNLGTFSQYTELAIWAGKDSYVRIINPMSMQGNAPVAGPAANPGVINYFTLPYAESGDNGVVTPMATWYDPSDQTTWVFLVQANMNDADRLEALYLTIPPPGIGSGQPYLQEGWFARSPGTTNSTPGFRGGVFVANGILYWAAKVGSGTGGQIEALTPTTGKVVWGPVTLATSFNKYQAPVVVNGALYINGQIFTAGGKTPGPLNN